MAVIKRLPQDVASRIAAGEVIERPASVLKELIENSIDAGATRVDVEALSGGRKLLRVCDDGSGMDPADCREAFERHATSKIAALEDMDALATFGFRGEALFATAAVSKVTLTSTLRGSRKGWRVEAEGGKIKSGHEAPPAPGTVIEVRDLFFNTPARAKFLKSEASEKSHLARVVEEAALANPGVAFSYKSEGRVLLRYPAGGDARTRIADILGNELGEALLDASFERTGLVLRAYLSPTESLQPSRSLQYCFVNRRPVASKTLQQALYRAYEPFRDKNRHPVVVLYLEIPADQIDVNVHPTKREIRFRSESELFELVASTLSRTLLKAKGIPTLSGGFPRRPVEPPSYSAPMPRFYSGQEEAVQLLAEPAATYAPAQESRPWFQEGLRFLGQIENAYLVFDSAGGLLVIDQHAAQERILFERYLKEIESGKPAVQKLMLPVPVELPASSIQRVLSLQDKLKAIGFEVAPYSKTTMHVLAVPEVFRKAEDVQDVVRRLLDGLLSPGTAAADVKSHAVATIACKASVKAHDRLDEREAVQLVIDLRKAADGTCCPHGRPAMLSLSRDELARRFKRPGAPPL